jgi:hypothetical protein
LVAIRPNKLVFPVEHKEEHMFAARTPLSYLENQWRHGLLLHARRGNEEAEKK